MQRIHHGPAHWDMILTIGEPGDPENDPTDLWPPNRKEVKVGTLAISAVTPEKEAGSYNINFDPLMLDDGIAATDDPVLLFRSSTDAEAARAVRAAACAGQCDPTLMTKLPVGDEPVWVPTAADSGTTRNAHQRARASSGPAVRGERAQCSAAS
jgi:hypothetical protein